MQFARQTPLELTVRSLPNLGAARFRVVSNSMSPLLRKNDQVRLQAYRPGQKLHRGDIIVFERDQKLVVHRIVSIKGELVQTKGDRLFVMDTPLQTEQVLAVVNCMVKGKIEINLQTWPFRAMNGVIARVSHLTARLYSFIYR